MRGTTRSKNSRFISKSQGKISFSTIVQNGQCYLCQGQHFIYSYNQFLNLSVKNRVQAVKRLKSTWNAKVAIKVNTKYEKQLCLDSGASSYMCSEKAKFKGVTTKTQTLNLANNDSTEIKGTGTVKLKTKDDLVAKFEETLYVLNLRSYLLSITKITDHDLEITFKKNKAIIRNPKTNKEFMIVYRNRNLYYIDEST